MFQNKKKGFTIVELVIVIAVVAILAAVLIPTFSDLVKQANMSVDEQLVKQMNTILIADEVINGKPVTAADAQEVLKKVALLIIPQDLKAIPFIGPE